MAPGATERLALYLRPVHRYFIKTPWLVKRLFSNYMWDAPASGNAVYLTFDDGPHETITPWVLDKLAEFGAKGTFFCIGKNVAAHPEIYNRIITEGHGVGNHTEQHLNGWKTPVIDYLQSVQLASQRISSALFRPPYGRIRAAQARGLGRAMGVAEPKVIMWDVLSADFDRNISPQRCINNVVDNTVPGSIIVFHDSEKAWPNLKQALPVVLQSFVKKGYLMAKL
ncbi:MAG: polysaccharide deacetylase family protein, partial [Chitinophagaceae bacterium]